MNKALNFLAEALTVIWSNRLRSLLTMLGLIIGVGSVIAILAVGDTTDKSVQNLLSPYAQSAIIVFPKQQQPDPQNAAIRYEDAVRVASMLPNAKVSPVLNVPIVTRFRHKDETIQLVTAGEGEAFDLTPLAEGRRFGAEDVRAHRRVCILSDAARTLFFGDGVPAAGRTLRLGGGDYTVVGVQAKPLNAGLLAGNAAGAITVTIPYSLIPSLGYSYVFGLSVIADSPADVAHARDDTIAALKKIHGDRAQYDERDIKSVNDGIAKTFAVLTTVISIVAGISLLVGGVGIMNIMLVSVTERTREIGIRKAIGATRPDILAQFLVEALLLCLIGGVIGLAIGVGIAELVIHSFIVRLTGTVVAFAWAPIMAVALLFSAGVAIAFGTYPAVRASFLNPIEALRYE